MSKGLGELQRFILGYLRETKRRSPNYDWALTIRYITEAWIHELLARDGDHDCADAAHLGRDGQYGLCNMEIITTRSDQESVRRACKRLAELGMVKLDHMLEARDQLLVYPLSVEVPQHKEG
jgi:hypothetical protein